MRKIAEHQEEPEIKEEQKETTENSSDKKTLEMNAGEILGLIEWHNSRISQLLQLLK